MKKFILPVLGLISLFAFTSCNSKDLNKNTKLTTEQGQAYVDEAYNNISGSTGLSIGGIYSLLSSKGIIKYSFSVDSACNESDNIWTQVGTYSSTIDFKNLTVSEETVMRLDMDGQIKSTNEKYTTKYENNKFVFTANDKNTEFNVSESKYSKEEIFEDIVTKNRKTDVFKTWHSNAASLLFNQYKLAVAQMHNISVGVDTTFSDLEKAEFVKNGNVVTVKCVGKESLPEDHKANASYEIKDKLLTSYAIDEVEGQKYNNKITFSLEF